MDALVIKVMMQLIAGELSGIKSAVPEKELLTDELLTQLYTLARKHDLAHLIGYSLDKNGLLPVSTVSDRFREQFYASVFRYERLNSDYLNICSVLEKSKIKFIPLKSAAFRQYYPEPWMRTSCDTDILVLREELERAKQALREKADCVCLQSSMHDISFKTQNENLIELHFDLLEEGRANSSAEILKDVWDYSFKKEGSEFVYTMSNECFCFIILLTLQSILKAAAAESVLLWICGLCFAVKISEMKRQMKCLKKQICMFLQMLCPSWQMYGLQARRLMKQPCRCRIIYSAQVHSEQRKMLLQ